MHLASFAMTPVLGGPAAALLAPLVQALCHRHTFGCAHACVKQLLMFYANQSSYFGSFCCMCSAGVQ